MKGNQEGCEALTTAPGAHEERRDMTRMHRRPGALAVLVAAAALALAACSSGSSTPQVASLGASTSSGASTDPGTSSGTSGGSTPATQSASGPTRLVNEWAACERNHGDPDQADPTIDANGVDQHHHPARGPAGRESPRAHRYVQPVPGRGPERAAGRQPGRPPAGSGRVLEVRRLHAGQRGPRLPLPHRGHNQFHRQRRGPRQPVRREGQPVVRQEDRRASLVD